MRLRLGQEEEEEEEGCWRLPLVGEFRMRSTTLIGSILVESSAFDLFGDLATLLSGTAEEEAEVTTLAEKAPSGAVGRLGALIKRRLFSHKFNSNRAKTSSVFTPPNERDTRHLRLVVYPGDVGWREGDGEEW